MYLLRGLLLLKLIAKIRHFQVIDHFSKTGFLYRRFTTTVCYLLLVLFSQVVSVLGYLGMHNATDFE